MTQNKQRNRYKTDSNSLYFHFTFYRAFTLVTLMLVVFTRLSAEPVTLRKALDIARKYVTPDSRSVRIAQTRSAGLPAAEPFYVFNDALGKGFVLIAGDDAMGEILACSDTGKLDTLNANPGVKLLLQAYRENFERLRQHPEAAKPATRAVPSYKAVAPLLSCKWNQDYPYNKKTGYRYSGCVATAMAQVMYFHKWPVQGKGESTYTVAYDNRVLHADFSKSRYDWAHMKDRYSYYYSYTDVEADAVALLMRDAGFASKMQYTADASGAYNEAAERAFQNHFDYTTAYVKRSDEGTAGFTEIVRQELLNGFPVYLSGYYNLGADGHSWVTDGLNERGLFHMNFGWGGQSDGYFSLTAADVSQSGSEFGGRPLSFKVGLIAILAHPNKAGVKAIDPSLLADSPKLMFTLEGSLMLPKGHVKTFDAKDMPAVEVAYFINKGKEFKGDIGVGIFDMEGKLLKVCPSDDHNAGGFTQRRYAQYDGGVMKRDYLINDPQKIKVNVSELANGYYQLLPICVPKKDDGNWGEWGRMKLAPRMEIEIDNGRVRVSEEDFLAAGFQFSDQPSITSIKPGSEEKVYFSVRNKGGLERTCYAKLQLLNADGTVMLEFRQATKTAFTGFDTTLLPFDVKIPADFAEGRYQVRLELIRENGIGMDNPSAERYTVGKLHDKDDMFFDISSQTTRIEDVTTTDFDLTVNGNTLTVRGGALQWVKVFDVSGRLLKHTVASDKHEIVLSLTGLSQGVYLVQAADGGHVRTRRFLKR